MNLTELSDEQLAQHFTDVVSEQERRQRLATIPTQISELKNRFIEDGGDINELP